ncbi:MAG: MMPL family transporter [Bacteroidales bacterium]|nr:MMPL family transporter [Bacteroidales bacterium]
MEKTPAKTHRFARLLVRWRGFLLIMMSLSAVGCALLIPRIRINDDITSNLPDDARMRRGMQLLESYFPEMDIRMQTLRVMFIAEAPADSLREAISGISGVAQFLGTEQRDSSTLYLFSLGKDAEKERLLGALETHFGDRILAEVEDNINIPDNLLLMLATGVSIALVILFLMCPSFLETLLFLLAIGIAVLINMGTNALLPSVYLVTHMLVAVLQMVLSMDFSIILMNRYRQEKQPGRTNEEAMVEAIAGAAPSILSSGLTTIASLIMLVFMRLKIGADLGIVLSKGVLCSLISTFTVLPALFILFDKAITRTEKRMLHIPTDGIAAFEMKHRIPLVVLFLSIFIGSWFLQKRTVISYSATFPTEITEKFPPKQAILLLYRTNDEEAFLPVAERIASDSSVISCLSYPTIALKPRTVSELKELTALAPEMAAGIPEEAAGLLYYAATHPSREERMRIDELEPAARELAGLAASLLPEDEAAALTSRLDAGSIFQQLNVPVSPVTKSVPATPPLAPQREEPEQEASEAASPERSLPDEAPAADTLSTESIVSSSDSIPRQAGFTYEDILQERNADEMGQILGIDPGNVSTVYRIAGKKGRSAKMNAYEFISTLNDKVLKNRLYASMIPKEQQASIREAKKEIETVLAAGPSPAPAAPPADTVATDAIPAPEPAPEPTAEPAPGPGTGQDSVQEAETDPEPFEEAVLSPMEQLAEMAFSGKRYTSAQVHRALSRAGVRVNREELDLLYIYHGYKTRNDTTTRLSLQQLTGFLDSLPAEFRVKERMEPLTARLGTLRNPEWSLAVVATDLPEEGPRTFAFLDTLETLCREHLSGETCLVGYPVMYKEIKDGFPRELLLLTLLTIGAIFLIVAFTFRSPVVPLILIPTVLSAVWLNVFASGLGGNTMLYISYLIVQSILMGATIDYSILFTQYYRQERLLYEKGTSLKNAYRKSFHAIMTSGLILILTPLLMVFTVSDPMISSILRCISIGALAAILLILFVLPATLTIADRWVCKK